jgi:AhpD family alkylhydroperoxidase
MATANRCEPGLILHAPDAMKNGATREQYRETSGVAVPAGPSPISAAKVAQAVGEAGG